MADGNRPKAHPNSYTSGLERAALSSGCRRTRPSSVPLRIMTQQTLCNERTGGTGGPQWAGSKRRTGRSIRNARIWRGSAALHPRRDRGAVPERAPAPNQSQPDRPVGGSRNAYAIQLRRTGLRPANGERRRSRFGRGGLWRTESIRNASAPCDAQECSGRSVNACVRSCRPSGTRSAPRGPPSISLRRTSTEAAANRTAWIPSSSPMFSTI